MKSANIIQFLKVDTGLKLQFAAHWVYILMSLQLYHSILPFLNFISTYLLCVLFIFFYNKTKLSKFSNHTYLSLFVICNSIYLNIVYNLKYFYFLHFVVLAGIFTKIFFRNKETNRGKLNPSIVGIFIFAMLTPQHVSHTPYLWSSEWWQLLLTVIIGIIVTSYAGTFYVSLSYIIGYVFGAYFFGEHYGDFIAWSLGIFSMTKLIHIFHVISEPQSSPKSFQGKILFGISIGLLEIYLKKLQFLNDVIIAYVLILTIHYYLNERYFEKSPKINDQVLSI